MSEPRKPLRLTPTGLVLLPLGTLSLVFALIAMLVLVSDTFTIASPSFLLLAGALTYAATIFLLSRNGYANVREFEILSETDELSQLPSRRRLHSDVERLSESDEEVAIALIDN